MQQHTSFTAINAVTTLLKIESRMKRELMDLLANNFSKIEIDRAIQTAVSIKVIRQVGLIKSRNHEQTTYAMVV
jgi:hypothetical protein